MMNRRLKIITMQFVTCLFFVASCNASELQTSVGRQSTAPQVKDNKAIHFGYKLIGRIVDVDPPREIATHFIDLEGSKNFPDTYFWDFGKYYILIDLNKLINNHKFLSSQNDQFELFGKIFLKSKSGKILELEKIKSLMNYKIISLPGSKEPIRIAKPNEFEVILNGVAITKNHFEVLSSENDWELVVDIQNPVRIQAVQYLSVNWSKP